MEDQTFLPTWESHLGFGGGKGGLLLLTAGFPLAWLWFSGVSWLVCPLIIGLVLLATCGVGNLWLTVIISDSLSGREPNAG